jgi:hypothetical protein
MLVYPLPMALMLLAIGAIVITNVTQDLTQLGGLWGKRPLMGLAFLAGAPAPDRTGAAPAPAPGRTRAWSTASSPSLAGRSITMSLLVISALS